MEHRCQVEKTPLFIISAPPTHLNILYRPPINPRSNRTTHRQRLPACTTTAEAGLCLSLGLPSSLNPYSNIVISSVFEVFAVAMWLLQPITVIFQSKWSWRTSTMFFLLIQHQVFIRAQKLLSSHSNVQIPNHLCAKDISNILFLKIQGSSVKYER